MIVVGLDGAGRVVGFRHQREHRANALGAGERALKLPGSMRDRRQRTIDRAEIAMTTVSSPIVSRPFITCMPPTTTMSAVPRMVIVVTTTEKSDCCQVIAIRASIVVSPAVE